MVFGVAWSQLQGRTSPVQPLGLILLQLHLALQVVVLAA